MKALLFVACLLAACGGGPEVPGVEESGAALCGNGVRPGCGQCVADPDSPTGGSKTCWTCDGDSHKQNCPKPTPPCGGYLQGCCANMLCNYGFFCTDNGTCLDNDASWCGQYGQPCCSTPGNGPASGTWCGGNPKSPVCDTSGHYYCIGEVSQ
jgi:hypothetical protein